ncbi:MAG: DUF6785 family protein [Phycisphaeraceae bacterium]
MTKRALFIAALLILFICGCGHFIQFIALLPGIIGGALPMAVFGVMIALTLLINPLLTLVNPNWALRTGELAMVVILGLSVCAYTGSSFLRYFGSAAVFPLHYQATNTHWQSTQAMAYVPGNSSLVAPGQVLTPLALAQRVVADQDADNAWGRLWHAAKVGDRQLWRDLSAGQIAPARQADKVAELLNRALTSPGLELAGAPDDSESRQVMAGRRWLDRNLSGFLAPTPAGTGVLLNDGRPDDGLTRGLLFGTPGADWPLLRDVPWSAWWPVIQTWCGLFVLLVLAAICLAVIVRPQWGQHERLAFPIVTFAHMMMRREPGRALPSVAYAPFFWWGFAAILLHLLNGFHAWFPDAPHIPLTYDFTPLRTLVPNSDRLWQATHLFRPTLNLTVIAFAFFLPRQISLTFGLGNIIYVYLALMLYARGISPNDSGSQASANSLLNFGAMLGMVAVFGYTGRRYYGQIAMAAMLGRGSAQTPAPSVWACRALVLLVPLAVLQATRSGLSPMFAGLCVGVVLLLWLVNARIVCETGLYRVGSSILPIGVAGALLGTQGMGPTQVILIAMVSVLFAVELWESPMVYAVTAMELADRTKLPVAQVLRRYVSAAAIGLAVAIVVTLMVQYHFGVLGRDEGVVHQRAILSLTLAARSAGELASVGELSPAVIATDVGRLRDLSPDVSRLGWIAAGLGLFGAFAVARLRWTWWPLHPVLFVLLGNWGLATFGVSFLVGWAIKSAVVGMGGAQAYHRALPLMCGIIAAGLAGATFWMVVGAIYFLCTGKSPERYAAF